MSNYRPFAQIATSHGLSLQQRRTIDAVPTWGEGEPKGGNLDGLSLVLFLRASKSFFCIGFVVWHGKGLVLAWQLRRADRRIRVGEVFDYSSVYGYIWDSLSTESCVEHTVKHFGILRA
jgi:hypothetical protein